MNRQVFLVSMMLFFPYYRDGDDLLHPSGMAL